MPKPQRREEVPRLPAMCTILRLAPGLFNGASQTVVDRCSGWLVLPADRCVYQPSNTIYRLPITRTYPRAHSAVGIVPRARAVRITWKSLLGGNLSNTEPCVFGCTIAR